MSGDSSRNKEFEEQLRLQQLYGQSVPDGTDPYTFTDPEDGSVYDWDHDKKAWFPKITEDFLAAYHANYGFTKDGEHDPDAAVQAGAGPAASGPEAKNQTAKKTTDPALDSGEGKQKGEKRKPDPGWFDVDNDKNTNVYVSGLPPDITTEEFVELMSKCGILMRDPLSEEYKVKLYKDNQGNQKGDGLCCYLKKESVALALRLIDESELRGYQLHVEAARFELKGSYDASKKKKKNKEYRKKMQAQQKQLDWRPEKKGEVRKRHEKVLIIQNMFHPSDFEEDPLVLNEIRDDLRTECEKFGQVKKVIIFDRHPDGVASVAFKEPEDADVCQVALSGRWFGGRKLAAELWDGTTDYQVEETTREREERLKGWANYLEGKGAKPAGPNPLDQLADAPTEPPTVAPTEPPTDGSTDKPSAASTDTPPDPEGSNQSEHKEAENQEVEKEAEKKAEKKAEKEAEKEAEQEADSTDSSMAGSDDEDT